MDHLLVGAGYKVHSNNLQQVDERFQRLEIVLEIEGNGWRGYKGKTKEISLEIGKGLQLPWEEDDASVVVGYLL
ncbi:hypothetical protein L6452_15359 [Arctium lappa]|uniref:Uncharacterized protein n=1 Tax=Arctium lappa TaxID=4217 RepID=A0ACB9CNE3_ARCLA|nr:hypothetical protein L6452_15359 [Arctium lappa]